jgi:Tfp pilus assembly protein PilF
MATATLTLAEQAEKKPSARGQSTVFLHLGKKNLEKGELKSAESQLRFAVMTDPGNPQCHWHLGRVFEAQGKIEKAV